jgi:antitoxin (DNA-binding transcriptional repressor) of toxin-antitoxin stability system
MRIVSLSVTEASRNFADCVNRARYQGTTFVLHKNGVAVARIVPEASAQAGSEVETAPEPVAAPSIQPQAESPGEPAAGPPVRRPDIW